MTTATRAWQDTMQAAREAADADFRQLAADVPLRNAWLAAYAARLADLAEPCTIEAQLVADGRAPRFYAGQRVEFIARFADCALNRGEWQAGEVARYLPPHFQPLPSVNPNLALYARVIGKRGAPIGRLIEVSEFQVRPLRTEEDPS